MKIALLAACLLASTAAIAATPFEAADIYRISMTDDVEVSPDGAHVLFTRMQFDIQTDRRITEWWLATVGKSDLDKRLLIGGEDDAVDIPARRDRRVDAKAARLLKKVGKLFPHLPLQPAFSWAGTFAETADGLPFFGPHPQWGPRVLFGMAYGGVMPLYAVIAREYFPMRIMGTVFGGAAMISSLGMALGPAVGGWIFDTFGGYGFLYIASFGIGLAAVAIALVFPPFPSEVRARVQPA